MPYDWPEPPARYLSEVSDIFSPFALSYIHIMTRRGSTLNDIYHIRLTSTLGLTRGCPVCIKINGRTICGSWVLSYLRKTSADDGLL